MTPAWTSFFARPLQVSLAAFVLRRILWAIPVLLLVMLPRAALMRGAGGTPFEPPEGVPRLPRRSSGS